MSDIICNCFNVSKEDIVEAIKAGATSVKEVQEATNAGNGCGTCMDAVKEVVEANL